MEVLLFFKHIVVQLLVGYLAFTNTLAGYVATSLGIEENGRYTREQGEHVAVQEGPSEALTSLSKMYSQAAGTIPRVLRDNSAFQEAASIANVAGVTESDTRTTSERDVKAALVNILCQYKTEDYIRTTTGTGFFIEETGVILTNAHVAQFLLLKEVDDSITQADCVIRTGDPAEPHYMADLLYISPTWILRNAALISEEMPRGTGEYDYALLYVTEATGDTELPSSFPSLPVYSELLPRDIDGSNVIAGGYPATKLIRNGVNAKLSPTVDNTTIEELYTFGSNYADIFSIAESAVGEHGASGGPVAHGEKGVIGLIVTKGDEATEGERSLRALTLSYIDRSIIEETGYTLRQNAQGDLSARGTIFKAALAPFLAHLLEVEL